MLRYVRIGNDDDRRNHRNDNVIEFSSYLGAQTPVALVDVTEDNLKTHLETTVKAYHLSYLSYIWTDLRGFAVFTACLHFLLMLIVASAIIFDAASGTPRLKSMTTKTITAWVGANVTQQAVVTKFGPNPKDISRNITITDTCKISGDRDSRSSLFNTRQIMVEVGEIDARIMILAFFFLSFVFQLLSAYDRVAYNAQLSKGNARRSHLIEYSVSASLMMLILCQQVDLVDTHLLANVFTNTWACMIFGLLSDVLVEMIEEPIPDADGRVQKSVMAQHQLELNFLGYEMGYISYRWLAHFAGWTTLFVAYSAIVSHMITFDQCVDGIEMPGAAVAAVALEAILFFCFGFVQFYSLVYKEHRYRKPRSLDEMPKYRDLKKLCDDFITPPSVSGMFKSSNTVFSRLGMEATSVVIPATSEVAHIQVTQSAPGFKAIIDEYHQKWQNEFQTQKSAYEKRQKERITTACSTEFMYIILSLLAKTTLGGIVYIAAIVTT
jgi:hypothetical protein